RAIDKLNAVHKARTRPTAAAEAGCEQQRGRAQRVAAIYPAGQRLAANLNSVDILGELLFRRRGQVHCERQAIPRIAGQWTVKLALDAEPIYLRRSRTVTYINF